jgi:hypothetical protein
MMAVGPDRRRHRAGHRLRVDREVVMRDGAWQMHYQPIIPRRWMRRLDVVLLERCMRTVAGAKGVGECRSTAAPAVINNARALRLRCRAIPATRGLMRSEHEARSTAARGYQSASDETTLDVLRGLWSHGTKEGCGEAMRRLHRLIDGIINGSCIVQPRMQKDVGSSRLRRGQDATREERCKTRSSSAAARSAASAPGMILAAAPLKPGASLQDVKTALAGNHADVRATRPSFAPSMPP